MIDQSETLTAKTKLPDLAQSEGFLTIRKMNIIILPKYLLHQSPIPTVF